MEPVDSKNNDSYQAKLNYRTVQQDEGTHQIILTEYNRVEGGYTATVTTANFAASQDGRNVNITYTQTVTMHHARVLKQLPDGNYTTEGKDPEILSDESYDSMLDLMENGVAIQNDAMEEDFQESVQDLDNSLNLDPTFNPFSQQLHGLGYNLTQDNGLGNGIDFVVGAGLGLIEGAVGVVAAVPNFMIFGTNQVKSLVDWSDTSKRLVSHNMYGHKKHRHHQTESNLFNLKKK
ncbi:MAG TPA: hypothetical protein DCE41_11395 [Cytophagales bacterium]|nr:hypothetical protein [Cytophagales bacterium]